MTARVISRSDEDSSASYELAASGATHEQIRCKCRLFFVCSGNRALLLSRHAPTQAYYE